MREERVAMIAELAAVNAAYDVIKQTVQNGQEIYECGEALAKYFGLKSEIQKKAHEHGYKSDLEAFMALEQLQHKEDELKQMMIYQGRAGMWQNWLSYQAEMKQSRADLVAEQEKARMERKAKLVKTIEITAGIVFGLTVCGGAGYVLWMLITMKGI